MDSKRDEIKEKLSGIYSQVLNREVKSDDLESGVGLLEKFHIDSLIALQIIVGIEREFGMVIEDDNFAIEMLNSIDKAVEFIGSQRGNR